MIKWVNSFSRKKIKKRVNVQGDCMKIKSMMTMLLVMSVGLYSSDKPENKKIAKIPFAQKNVINLSSRKESGYAVRRQIDGGCWYAVYDEHDKKGVGECLVSFLHTEFKNLVGDSIEEKMKAAFLHVNKHKDFGPAGASVAVVFIKDGYAHVAHVGDCRVVIAQNGAIQKTEDHTAWNQKEVDRINSLNINGVGFLGGDGSVVLIDDQRYTKTYEQKNVGNSGSIITHVTRSIGDHNTHQEAITPAPEYMRVKLDDPQATIVIGSFGFWTGCKKKIDVDGLKNYVNNFKNNRYNNSAFMVIKPGKEFDPYHETKRFLWRGIQVFGLAGVIALLSYNIFGK